MGNLIKESDSDRDPEINCTPKDEIITKACLILHEATEGLGTNEHDLFSVLKTVKEASEVYPTLGIEIRKAYLRMYNEDLLHVLEDELWWFKGFDWGEQPDSVRELE